PGMYRVGGLRDNGLPYEPINRCNLDAGARGRAAKTRQARAEPIGAMRVNRPGARAGAIRVLGATLGLLGFGGCAGHLGVASSMVDSRAALAPLTALSGYPKARIVELVERTHGLQVSDPYRWLEDGATAEVVTWFREQDRLARTTLDGLPERAVMAARLRELQEGSSREQVVHAGGSTFYTLLDGAHDRGRVMVESDAGGAARVAIDPNGWADTNLGDWVPSPDGLRIAYEVKRHNADSAVLQVIEVATGRVSG
ncbi:MAG: hypothetical protein M3O50_06955, partial [Myxococcota bacterium]|nr:hypothetical protein [Myxococcota bacterium]